MEQRKSQDEVLKQFVSEGHLTSEQADEIAQAPILAFSARELVSYLAAILITIGVGFMVAGLVVNVPKAGIAVLLYVVAVVLAYFSRKFSSGKSEKQRAGDVLEIASVLAIAVGSGILLDMTSMRSEWSACILAIVAGTWGVMRAPRTQFSGSVLMTASVPVAIMSSTSMMSLNGDSNSIVIGLLLMVSGLGLIYMGMRHIGFGLLPRSVGSLLIVIGSITLAIITDLFRLEVRGRVMGFVQMAFASSQVLGLPIGLYFANLWDWHSPFMMIVIVSIVVMGAMIMYLKPIDAHLKVKSDRNAFEAHTTTTYSKNIGTSGL